MQSFTLTTLTQAAISVLFDIANGGELNHFQRNDTWPLSLSEILLKLERKNLIRLKANQTEGALSSYELTLPVHMITLLDIFEATGENIDYDYFAPQRNNCSTEHTTNNPEAIKRIVHGYLETIKLTNLNREKINKNND